MITREDILRVAYDLKENLSENQISWILKEYPNYVEMYPTDNWSEIVEQMIFEVNKINDNYFS